MDSSIEKVFNISYLIQLFTPSILHQRKKLYQSYSYSSLDKYYFFNSSKKSTFYRCFKNKIKFHEFQLISKQVNKNLNFLTQRKFSSIKIYFSYFKKHFLKNIPVKNFTYYICIYNFDYFIIEEYKTPSKYTK